MTTMAAMAATSISKMGFTTKLCPFCPRLRVAVPLSTEPPLTATARLCNELGACIMSSEGGFRVELRSCVSPEFVVSDQRALPLHLCTELPLDLHTDGERAPFVTSLHINGFL